jgi:pilus assembly protein CpaC
VADVSDKEVVIVAKQAGETTLTVWDRSGERTFYINVYMHDLDRTKKRLEKLIYEDLNIKNVSLKKNETIGKIMIIGEISAPEKEQLDKALTSLFEKTDPMGPAISKKVENLLTVKKESKMIEIEARILELNKSELERLGVKWMEYLQVRQERYKATTGAETGGVETTLDIMKPWTALWGMGKWSRDALHARLDLLVSTGKARDLSRPKLLCLSGEEAKLTVGGEVPYISGSTSAAAGTTVSISYREYGVIFKLRPLALSDNKIFLNLGAEVSELDWANAIIVSGIRVPAFTKREANTVLNLASGETIFIAGLIRNKESRNLDKFPALGDIPVIGSLFRSREFQNDQTELVVSLTPVVVESKDKAAIDEIGEISAEKYKSGLASQRGSIIPDELQSYVLKVQKKILNHISYPKTLLGTGWEGTVVLKLNIERTGDLKDVQISKSSGYRIFDEEALKTVRSLSFSSFPQDVQIEELKIEIPIAYSERQ